MKSRSRELIILVVAVAVLAGCSGTSPQQSPTPTPSPTLAPTSTPAKTNASALENYVYYVIEGSTAAELRAQMDQLGPADKFGRFDAYTRWYINWSYPYSTQDGQCTTGPVKVAVRVTLTLPQWDPPSDASQELVDKWNAYLAALQVHEDGHKEIAIQAGNEILHTLEGLPPHPTCDELEEAADAAGKSVLNRYRQQEIIYDQSTDHGATQGARFP
jgi:predicted secreted Zn-dependent protease